MNLFNSSLVSREYARQLWENDSWAESFALLEDADQCFLALSFIHRLYYSQTDLGDAALLRGMLEQAEGYYRQSIPYADRSGIIWLKQYAIYRLGIIALRKGREQEANTHFRTVLFNFARMETPDVTAYALRGLAAIRAIIDPYQAARLEGHAAALYIGSDDLKMADPVIVTPRISTARDAIGEAEFTQCAAHGARMSIEEILSGSLPPENLLPSQLPPPVPHQRPQTPLKAEKLRFSGLTAREREVAVLITQGHSNPSIARLMMLSNRTITTHVTHILAKLGFSARTQIAAWAVEKGLLKST